MAALSIKVDNEVYIYINGKLTMKRWIKAERSIVFNNNELPYDKNTLRSVTEENGVIIDKIN